MHGRIGLLRSVFLCSVRALYQVVKPHSKLLIKSASQLEVSCFPACEAESSSVILPDSSVFRVDDGCKIVQTIESNPVKDCINKIRIPARRGWVVMAFNAFLLDIEIIHSGCDPIYLVNYEGPKAMIRSLGPVFYAKLKVICVDWTKFVIGFRFFYQIGRECSWFGLSGGELPSGYERRT